MEDKILNIKKLPLVTVCIPAYNHEKYVGETIQSVIDQTYENIELIIINDGSKDKTDEVIRKYIPDCKKRFVRFEYRNRENRGLSKTLNEMIALASGKYIKVIASDDFLHAESITPFVRHLESQNCNIVFGDLLVTDEMGLQKYRVKGLRGLGRKFTIEGFCICESLKRSPIFGSPWIMQTNHLKKVGGFDINSKIEDWEFINRLTISNTTFSYIEKVASFYRKFENKNPYFGSHTNWLKADLYVLNKYKSYCPGSFIIGIRNVFNRSISAAALTNKKDLYNILKMATKHPVVLPILFRPNLVLKIIMPTILYKPLRYINKLVLHIFKHTNQSE